MIYVHNKNNFFSKLNTVLNTDSNDTDIKLTTINNEYKTLKTEMERQFERYKSKFTNKTIKQKQRSKFPLINSHHKQKLSGDSNCFSCQKTEPVHNTPSSESKTFISLFKSSISQNKKSLNNYKQCIKEIEKEFYITRENYNPNKIRQKQNENVLSIPFKEEKKKDEENDVQQRNSNIALKINKLIQEKITHEQEEAKKLEELKQKIKLKKEKIDKRFRVMKNGITYLQSNGINVNKYLNYNPFPTKPFSLPYSQEFITAAKFNQKEIIEQALNKNLAYLYEYDYYGQTAFHWAAKMGYVDLLQLLMKKGKCCNLYDKKRRTPLYHAALNNQTECCFILINKTGNLDLCDIDEKRPYDVITDPKLKHQILEIMDKHSESNEKQLKIYLRKT